MNYDFLLDQNGISLVIRTSGKSSEVGFDSLYRELVALPNRGQHLTVLIDNQKLDMDTISSDRVRASAESLISLSEQLGTGRLAIVVGTERDYGLARMWEQYTENDVKVEIEIFRSTEEAERWLKS